jgi:serine/threonine protein phosphatase PrpC/CRP-like cAMP-binding protein
MCYSTYMLVHLYLYSNSDPFSSSPFCIDPHKANQDAFSVTKDFCGQKTDAFFGIYDGHGRDGDRCAQFARDKLPELLEKFVMRSKSKESKLHQARGGSAADSEKTLELTKDQIQTSCLKAHIECNRAMHKAHELDDSLSGTTSISMYFHGRRNRITINNVGDSRAIVGQQQAGGVPGSSGKGSSLKAIPLSRDQTPYRRDERVRVRATGARILSLDQIEGLEPIVPDDDEAGDLELGEELDEGGDPPRVWSPHGEYPGTAFTRSLGDAIAEELGVFAEPEMLTREVTSADKILVLASDGVFEFLTNQSVIDMCAKFTDPLAACRAVVAESYELWLQYELRTDDITMICIFIDGVESKSLAGSFISASSRMSLDAASLEMEAPVSILDDLPGDDDVDGVVPVEGLRPVRMHVSKEKSKAIQQMKIKMASESDLDVSAMEEFDLSKLYTKKTPEEKGRIAEAIRASVMFQNISDEQREMIFGVMEPITVKKGSWVIKQGTVGDRFYIVDNGRFEVRIVPDGENDAEGTGGNVVHVYEGSHEKHAHPSFGELALMYSAPRAASIIAQTDGHIWALHRYAFRQVLAQQSGRQDLSSVLKKIGIFKSCKTEDINNLAAAMDEVTFGRGEMIIEQGRAGEAMYIIQKGSCGKSASPQQSTPCFANITTDHSPTQFDLYYRIFGTGRRKGSQ